MVIQELVFNAATGRDEWSVIEIDFDPSQYTTKAGAAKALHKALSALAKASGQNPKIEVILQTPEQAKLSIGSEFWRVIWEAGPYEWAIGASMQCHNMSRDGGWFTEPHYSFDLCFVE